MEITYSKEGMKITHPSGTIQILSTERLAHLKAEQLKKISNAETELAILDTHTTELQKRVNSG